MTHRCGLGGVKEGGEIPPILFPCLPWVHHPCKSTVEVVLLGKSSEVFAVGVVVLIVKISATGSGRTDVNDLNYVDGKYGRNSGNKWGFNYSITGYFAKKVVYYQNAITQSSQVVYEYPFPIIRLGDLYLMYAESLNEATEGDNNVPEEVYTYLRKVRERSGLKKGVLGQTEDIGDVRVAWEKYSNDPTKPKTKDGMRSIIKQERKIELALEGHQYNDLRRWKDASKELSKSIKGWNVQGEIEEDFYKVTTLFVPRAFTTKDYLWPIKKQDLQVDDKLIQTYGW